MQSSKLVILFKIAAYLDKEVGKHAFAEQIYDVIAKETKLDDDGKSLLRDYYGFEGFEVGEFGKNVPEADYQTKRDPFRDNPTERGPEPKSDMLAAAAALEARGEFVLARQLRKELGL